MLYHKAWLESRVRFLAGGAVLAAYCVSFVQQSRLNFPPVYEPMLPYSAHVWRGIYNGPDTMVFVLMAAMLGLGGIEREREPGSCAFTLALPVTRVRLLWPRIAVALLELVVLAAIPLVVVPWMSASIGRVYPAALAARFALLFAVTGALWVSASVLCSVTMSATHTNVVAAVLAPAACAAIFGGTPLGRHPGFNPFNVMNGARLPFLDRSTDLLIGPLPWATLAAFVLVSAALLAAAAAAARRRDF